MDEDEETPYFTEEEINTLMKWANQAIRIQEEQRSKHFRNSDRDNAISAKAAERIEYYSKILGKIMELPIAAKSSS